MPEYLDSVAACAPSRICLVVSETSSVLCIPGRPLRELLREMRAIYGPYFEYKLVFYERMNEK